MRKTLLNVCLLCGVGIISIVHAQQTAAPVKAPVTSTTANSINTPDAVDVDSFASVAALGEEIAIAQRKIQAMTLKHSLDALQAQQDGGASLKVIRVEGFGDTLYAVLTDDTGAIYQVGPGDIINKQYRVTSLRPYSVGLVDIKTNKFYVIPFQTGGVGVDSAGLTTTDASESAPASDQQASTTSAS